jgi:hypothetical protein
MDQGLAANSVEPYKSTFGNRVAAYATGLTNVPFDLFKYSALGTNKLMNMTGLRDNETAANVYSAFVDLKNPLDINNYETKEPSMFNIGETIGNAVGIGKIAKTIAGPNKVLNNRGLAASVSSGAAQESFIEPALKRLTAIELPTKQSTTPSNNPPSPSKTGLNSAEITRLAEIESSNAGYDAFNPRSGAYGKYQFIPSTAKVYAEKLGLKGDEWKTPENQDRMFAAFTADNTRGLERKGLPTDLFHIYGAHQQGLTGFSNILKGNITPTLEKNMRSNIPNEYKNLKGEELRDAWINYWKEKTQI